jgi:hypothetical protein
LDIMHRRFVLVAAAALVLTVAPAGASPSASSLVLTARAVNVPPEPKLCTGPVAGRRGVFIKGTQWTDTICGTRGDDTLIAIGGNDHAWGYQGVDDFGARNGWPDEVYGGPGTDTGRFDPCDKVVDIERKSVAGSCPGVVPRRLLEADDALPFDAPVVECYRGLQGERIIAVLVEPQMRAVDATARVDFQTVAWSAGLLRIEDGKPVLIGQGSWFWDRVYDEQVQAFPGNYWRSFKTAQRTFVRYTVAQPGVYVLGVYLHWYATEDSPEHDDVAIARAHYGPAEQADHEACVFLD